MSTLKNFRYVARTLSGGALLAGLLVFFGEYFIEAKTWVAFPGGNRRGNARTLCGNYAANPYCDHRR